MADIQEVIEGELETEELESDIEDQSEMEKNTDIPDGAEYMDDFEDYDSSEVKSTFSCGIQKVLLIPLPTTYTLYTPGMTSW